MPLAASKDHSQRSLSSNETAKTNALVPASFQPTRWTRAGRSASPPSGSTSSQVISPDAVSRIPARDRPWASPTLVRTVRSRV